MTSPCHEGVIGAKVPQFVHVLLRAGIITLVTQYAMPGEIRVADFGAVPDDGRGGTPALRNAAAAMKQKPGSSRPTRGIAVLDHCRNVEITGNTRTSGTIDFEYGAEVTKPRVMP